MKYSGVFLKNADTNEERILRAFAHWGLKRQKSAGGDSPYGMRFTTPESPVKREVNRVYNDPTYYNMNKPDVYEQKGQNTPEFVPIDGRSQPITKLTAPLRQLDEGDLGEFSTANSTLKVRDGVKGGDVFSHELGHANDRKAIARDTRFLSPNASNEDTDDYIKNLGVNTLRDETFADMGGAMLANRTPRLDYSVNNFSRGYSGYPAITKQLMTLIKERGLTPQSKLQSEKAVNSNAYNAARLVMQNLHHRKQELIGDNPDAPRARQAYDAGRYGNTTDSIRALARDNEDTPTARDKIDLFGNCRRLDKTL